MVSQRDYGGGKSTNRKDIEAEVNAAFEAASKKTKQSLAPHGGSAVERSGRSGKFGSGSRSGSFGGGRSEHIGSSVPSPYETEKEGLRKAAEKEFAHNTADWGQTVIRTFAVNPDFPQGAGLINYLQLLQQSPKGIEYERYTAAEQEAEKARRIEEMREWAKENGRSPILSALYKEDTNGVFNIPSGLSLITAPFQGSDYVLDALETAYVGAPLPSSEPDFTETTQALREGVSEDMTETGQFVYHTAMSAADSLISGWLGGGSAGGGILLGLGAASNTAHDIMDRGGTEEQALIGGAVSGILEGVFEKLSLGQLEKMKYLPADTAKNILGNLAKSVVTNAGEEFTAELANAIFDAIFMDELSTHELTVQGYMAQGKSEERAKRLANLDLLARLGESAASGALTGALFGTGASAASYHRSRLAAQGEARLRAKEMPTPTQLRAMNLSESEALGAMVLLDSGQFDDGEVAKHKFSEMTEDEKSNIVEEYRVKVPIEIPNTVTGKAVSKPSGYEQISYKWNDGTHKYEVRWHTRTPGAPESQGNTWVIERKTRGDGENKPITQIMIGYHEWVNYSEWQCAIEARRNGIATQEQLGLLEKGHWKE